MCLHHVLDICMWLQLCHNHAIVAPCCHFTQRYCDTLLFRVPLCLVVWVNPQLYVTIGVMFRSIVGSFKPQCLHIRTLLACTYCITMPHTDRIPCHVTGPYLRILGANDLQIPCQTLAFQERGWVDTLGWGLGMLMSWVLYGGVSLPIRIPR